MGMGGALGQAASQLAPSGQSSQSQAPTGKGGVIGQAVQQAQAQQANLNPYVNIQPMQQGFGPGVNNFTGGGGAIPGAALNDPRYGQQLGPNDAPIGQSYPRQVSPLPAFGGDRQLPSQFGGNMPGQQGFGHQGFNANRFENMQDKMEKFQDRGQNIPQGFQDRYNQMMLAQKMQMGNDLHPQYMPGFGGQGINPELFQRQVQQPVGGFAAQQPVQYPQQGIPSSNAPAVGLPDMLRKLRSQ